MDLSTALIISLFLYGIFLALISIEYFTDKRRKERRFPPQATEARIQEPQRENTSHHMEGLQDLESLPKGEEPTGSPRIWEEEEFE